MQATETPVQTQVVAKLVKKGFRVNTVFHAHDEDVVEVMMMRKRGPSTRYADVDSEGLVNGQTLTDFLASL